VVLLHGFKGFKDWGMFPPLADRLARAGFTAVSFNMSGSGVDDAGESVWPERFGHNTFSIELQDLATVLAALRSGQLAVAAPARLGLLGHSRGGGVAILHGSVDPGVAAVVTWAAISHVDRMSESKEEWRARGRIDVVNTRTGQVLPLYTDLLDDIERHGKTTLDIAAAARKLAAPWLIIHGTEDPVVPVAEAERLGQLNGGKPRTLSLLAGAGHTFGAVHPYRGTTPHLERATAESVGFFSLHLA
jgi:pimeloyl-ACP methyl ester carboxylesterase